MVDSGLRRVLAQARLDLVEQQDAWMDQHEGGKYQEDAWKEQDGWDRGTGNGGGGKGKGKGKGGGKDRERRRQEWGGTCQCRPEQVQGQG